jgi:hypothetical protein
MLNTPENVTLNVKAKLRDRDTPNIPSIAPEATRSLPKLPAIAPRVCAFRKYG